jgi:hypothetical protein
MTSFNKLKIPATGGNKKQHEESIKFSNKHTPKLIAWEIENKLSVTIINVRKHVDSPKGMQMFNEPRLLIEPLSTEIKKQKEDFLESLGK